MENGQQMFGRELVMAALDEGSVTILGRDGLESRDRGGTQMMFFVGLDLGQRRDFSAVAVVER